MKTSFTLLAVFAATALHAQETFPVSIRVDAAKSLGELKPIWRSSAQTNRTTRR